MSELGMGRSFVEPAGSPGARAAAPLITGDVGLDDVWPEVSRRLAASLRSRGAQPADVEDAIQECAVRLLSCDLSWRSADDLLPWCLTVARHHLIDQHRRRARLTEQAEEEAVSAVDVHAEVAARLSLRAVVGAWSQLSDRDRASLAAAASGVVPEPRERREAVRVNVARHRARQRLQALVATSLGALLVGGRLVRRCAMPSAALVATGLSLALVLPLPDGASAASPPGAWVQDRVEMPVLPVLPAPREVLTHRALPLTRPDARSARGRGTRSVSAPRMVLHPVKDHGVTVTPHEAPSGVAALVCLHGAEIVRDVCVGVAEDAVAPATSPLAG